MVVRTVRGRREIASGTPFVQFSVYRSRQDGVACGYHVFQGKSAEGEPAFVTSPFGVPVEDAWSSACALANEQQVEIIWINDPETLFSAPGAAARAEAEEDAVEAEEQSARSSG